MALIIPTQTWQSAHRPIVYRYTFTSFAFASTTPHADGARIFMLNTSAFTVGQRVFIPSGEYSGNHVVAYIFTNQSIVINTDYISNSTGSVIPLSNIDAEVWAGYPIGHDGYSIYPYRKIAEFVASAGINGEITMDISGYAKSLFKNIGPPQLGVDLNMSFPIYLKVTGLALTTRRYILNGTILPVDLQPHTVTSSPVALQIGLPVHFTNGRSLYSKVENTTSLGLHIVNIIGADGLGNIGGLGFDAIGSTFTIG